MWRIQAAQIDVRLVSLNISTRGCVRTDSGTPEKDPQGHRRRSPHPSTRKLAPSPYAWPVGENLKIQSIAGRPQVSACRTTNSMCPLGGSELHSYRLRISASMVSVKAGAPQCHALVRPVFKSQSATSPVSDQATRCS